jgi:hypothetical protein
MPPDTFAEAFGVTWQACLAYAALHLHLYVIGRRLARVEATPTVARELRAAESSPTR